MPSTIDKKERDSRLGLKAEELLSNEFFLAILETLKQDCINAWVHQQGTRPDDILARERHHLYLKALNDLRQKLEIIAANGKMARRPT